MIAHLKRVPIWGWALALALVPMAIQIVMKWYSLPLAYGKIIGAQDPDPWLRLTLVRIWLSGGSWYDHVVANGNAPWGGISSPWTRPLDLVIAFFTQLQPDSVELNIRLVRTALLLPLLWMGLLLLGLYRNARILCPLPTIAFMVTAFIASCLPMHNYFSSGNADHHTLLAVIFIWAFAGVLTPNPSPRLTILTGALLALQLWISPEAFILIGAIYGWYGLMWLTGDRARARPWALLATTIAMSSAAALMIERQPAEWFTPIYDSISIVYVVMLTLIASAVWLLQAANPASSSARLLLAGASAAIVGAISLHAFPLIVKGPLAEVDPFILSDFMPRIVEAQSLFTNPPLYILAMLIQPILAVYVLARAYWRRDSLFSDAQLAQLSYFLLATGALFLVEQRFYYYFYPVVALVLAPVLTVLFTPDNPKVHAYWPARWIGALSPNRQMLHRLSLMAVAIGVPLLLFVIVPMPETTRSRGIGYCQATARQLIYGGALNEIGHGKPLVLFTSTDLGGEILFWTPHRIIASNYHREGTGIKYIWQADSITDPHVLHRYLATRQVGMLLLCPVVRAPENSVLQRLQQHKIGLDWLSAVSYIQPPPLPDTVPEKNANPAIFLVK